jgi:hypothetical protein
MAASTTEGTGPGSANNIKHLIFNGDVKAENIVFDALVDYRVDIEATGKITADGNLVTHSAVVADGDVSSGGNITADGYIRGSALGQLLNTSLWTFSSGNVTNASGTYTDLTSVSYTPVSASSALLIEYHAAYTVSGSAADSWRSRITVDGSEITYRLQNWVATLGQDVRSSVLLPISMKTTNGALTARTVKVQAARQSGDDTLTVDTNSAFLRISEFAV